MARVGTRRETIPMLAVALAAGAWGCGGSTGEIAAPRQGAAAEAAPAAMFMEGRAGEEWIHSAPAGVYFTRTQVTVSQYRACVDARRCAAVITPGTCNVDIDGRGDHPMNCIDREQAAHVCEWLGGRLPTEAEWLAEASNDGARRYPWGDEKATCERAIWRGGCDRGTTWPVCSRPAGNSVSGLCDMSGNIWEWTSTGADAGHRVVLGGAWYSDRQDHLSAAGRFEMDRELGVFYFGARCVRSTAPPAAALGVRWVTSEPAGTRFTESAITVSQYRACVDAGWCSANGLSMPYWDGEERPEGAECCNWDEDGRGDHPMNCIDREQAAHVCEWLGGRLPTEVEWYAEASDDGARRYPWGDEGVTCERAIWRGGCGHGSTWPVCSRPAGNSVSGLCDMSGNVWEWVLTIRRGGRGLRGGSWGDVCARHLRASYRGGDEHDARRCYTGVRCAR